MARRRLTPANPDYFTATATPETQAPPIARVAGESSARAALEDLARDIEAARDEGRMVLALPHEALRLDHLVRDRLPRDGEEMQALTESLRARGQQTPIEVQKLEDGQYGLISGWRRAQALRQLHAETGEARFASVQALVRRPGDAAEAYLAMVEENEIRADLSHYERARIVAKAVERGVFAAPQEALRALFTNASRAKRSKIGSFLRLVEALDGVLRFPEALPERAGLALVQALEADPGLAARLREDLGRQPAATAAEEQSRLAKATRKPPRPRSGPAEVAPGLRLAVARDGSLTLSGAKVDAALRADLEAWLRGRV